MNGAVSNVVKGVVINHKDNNMQPVFPGKASGAIVQGGGVKVSQKEANGLGKKRPATSAPIVQVEVTSSHAQHPLKKMKIVRPVVQKKGASKRAKGKHKGERAKRKSSNTVRPEVSAKDRLDLAKRLLQIKRLPNGMGINSQIEKLVVEVTGGSQSTARRWMKTVKEGLKQKLSDEQMCKQLGKRGRRKLISEEGFDLIKEKFQSEKARGNLMTKRDINEYALEIANRERRLFNREALTKLPKTSRWRMEKRLIKDGLIKKDHPRGKLKKTKKAATKTKTNHSLTVTSSTTRSPTITVPSSTRKVEPVPVSALPVPQGTSIRNQFIQRSVVVTPGNL